MAELYMRKSAVVIKDILLKTVMTKVRDLWVVLCDRHIKGFLFRAVIVWNLSSS
jgi:hypothetical protein